MSSRSCNGLLLNTDPIHYTAISLCTLATCSMQKFESKHSASLLFHQGYPQSIPTCITYAPPLLSRASLQSFYTKQGVLQTKMFLCHPQEPNLSHNLVAINLYRLQVHAGTTYPVLSANTMRLQHLTDI